MFVLGKHKHCVKLQNNRSASKAAEFKRKRAGWANHPAKLFCSDLTSGKGCDQHKAIATAPANTGCDTCAAATAARASRPCATCATDSCV
jgi:hypothetical protein